MSNLYEDGDLFLPIRTKLNAVNELFKIAETDALIVAGATTSIPVTTIAQNLLISGAKVTLMDINTGETHELTTTSNVQSADEAISVSSYTFTDDIAVGSGIYFKYKDLLTVVYGLLI